MPVRCASERSWDDGTRGVYSLKNIMQVYPSGNLLDQHRCEAQRSKVLMNAKKINLGHLNSLFVDSHWHRNRWNERNKFLFIATAHANEPFWFLIGQVERPFEKWYLVVKTESLIHILYVMLRKKIVKLNTLSFNIKIYVWPIEAIW